MKICYIGTHDEPSKAFEEFCKGYDCTFEYDESAESSESLVSALKSAFKYNLIVVNLDCLHNKKIDDDFLYDCFEQYKKVKSELILYRNIPPKFKDIGYPIISDVNADRKSLEKWLAAYGFKLLPKKAEENLFSSLITSDTPNQSVEKIERLKKSDISKDSKKTSEEKSEEKVKTKPVTLSDSLDSIDQIFGKMPVQLENIKKLNDDTTQEKPISNSQDKQQRVENIQPTTLTMNTEPIENTSFPQKQNSEFATYTQVKPESFDNKKDFDIPIQKRTIGVIGSLDRIGTTTQAIQITRFLSNIGQSVCYVQDNNSNFLDMLIKYYYDVNVDTGSECILYDGLYLNRKKNLVYDKEYEVEVYDYGCPVNIPSDFFEKNIRIVVCGGSPDEIDRLTAMISQLYSDDKIYYVFSFVANHDKQNVLDIMSERKSKCYFAPYSPDCFAQISDENADMYYDILGIEKPKKKKGLFRRGNKDAKV